MGRPDAPRKAFDGGDKRPLVANVRRKLHPRVRLSYILAQRQESIRPTMNAPTELSHDEMLGIKLEVLRREHRDLDQAIHALEQTGRPDVLTLRRLKKQKLFLKDQIVKIEDMLIPDIIA
jgi:hypothetical protein